MSKNTSYKITNPQLFHNYSSTILSLFAMLYLLGISGLVVVYTNELVAYAKENISFYVELKEDANEATVFDFQKKMELFEYVTPKTVQYISKDAALETLTKDGMSKEDMMPFGENLLPNMLQFKINPNYSDTYEQVVLDLKTNDFIEDVFYTDTPTESIASKVYLLNIILSVLMLFFIFVVITLIQGKLKLLLAANRDSVGIMQTAGATLQYMSKPYTAQSLKNGLLSGVLAVVAVWGTRYLFEDGLNIEGVNMEAWAALLSMGLVVIGLLLPWLLTKYIVERHLSKSVKEWNF